MSTVQHALDNLGRYIDSVTVRFPAGEKSAFDKQIDAENYRRQWQGFPFEGGMHRAGIGAGPQPGESSAVTIQGAVTTTPSGVQQVQVMNPQVPNVTATINITEAKNGLQAAQEFWMEYKSKISGVHADLTYMKGM